MVGKVSADVICQGHVLSINGSLRHAAVSLIPWIVGYTKSKKGAMGREWHWRCTFCRDSAWIAVPELTVMCTRLDVDNARIYFAGTSKPTSRTPG